MVNKIIYFFVLVFSIVAISYAATVEIDTNDDDIIDDTFLPTAAADGSTKGIASFTANDFDASSGNISIDYANAQKATNAQPGLATAAQITSLETVDSEDEIEAMIFDSDAETLLGNWDNTANPWSVNEGGTGANTLVDGGILLGSGIGAITALGVAANGQIPIGDGTTDPVLATITGTASEVTVTNGAGTITLSLPSSIDLGGKTLEIPNSDADPSVTGQLRLDTSVTNYTNGAIRFYDGSNIRQVVDLVAATAEGCTDDYVLAYDADADLFYCKEDSTGSGSLGSNLTSTTDDITTDNTVIELKGNSEDLDIEFGSNSIDLTTDTGVTEIDLIGIDLKDDGVAFAKVAGDIGAATATTPSADDNDTSVATTAYVQTEIAGFDTEDEIEAMIFDADAESVGGVWEWQDGIAQTFGNDADWSIAYDEASDDRLEYTHSAGAGADVYFDLNDNAADSTFTITNSDGTYEANLAIEGEISGSYVPGASDDVDLTGANSVLMGPLEFEGATADDYETTFTVTDPTADRTITIPNSNQTIGTATTLGAAVIEDANGVNTGTATDQAVTADALAGSYAGTKDVGWTIYDSDVDTATGDGKQFFSVPASMNGMDLVDVTASVADLNSATGGTTTVVIRRVRGATAADMTSTGVTVDYDAYTASDETVDTDNDDLQTGDKIFVDVDAVTTGAVQKGLSVTCLFRLP